MWRREVASPVHRIAPPTRQQVVGPVRRPCLRSVAIANEDARRFGDEFRRQLKKHQTPRLKSGTVIEPADTWDNTVLVQCGTELNKATYRGAVPHVGDAVEIQRTGTGYKVVVQIPPVLFPDSSGALNLPLSPPGNIGKLTAWGHSWVDTVVGNQGQLRLRSGRFPDRLAGMFGVDWPNYRNRGTSGEGLLVSGYSAIQNGVTPDRPTSAPYVATSGAHFIVTGLNDVAVYGPMTTQVLNAWKHAWRSSIARLWAGGVFEPLDPTFVYSGTGWSTVTSPWNSARSIRQTVNQGAGFNWNVPANHPGGYVNLRFVGEHQGTQAGATAITITAPPSVTGGGNQVFTIATHNAMTGRYSTVNQRIFLPKTGAIQVVNATASTLAAGGRMAVDCAEIEDPNPPRVVAMTVAKPFDWGIYSLINAGTNVANRTGTAPPLGAQAPDAWLDAPNLATTQVFTEFGAPVNLLLLDQGLTMDGRNLPQNYMDDTHPNALGDIALTRQLYDGFGLLQSALTATNTATSTIAPPSTPHEPEDVAMWNMFVGAD